MSSDSFSNYRRGVGRGRGRGRGRNEDFNHNNDRNMSIGRGRGRISSSGSGIGYSGERSRGRGRGMANNDNTYSYNNNRGFYNSSSSWMAPKPIEDTTTKDSNKRPHINRNSQSKPTKEAELEEKYFQQQKKIQEQLEKEEDLKLQQLVKANETNDDGEGADAFTYLLTSKQNGEEESANQRRARRRHRLKQLTTKEVKDDDAAMATISGKEEAQEKVMKRERSLYEQENKTNENGVGEEEEGGGGGSVKRKKIDKANDNDHIMTGTTNDDDTKDDGNDSFDMFASTSPLSTGTSSKNARNIATTITTAIQQNNNDNDEQNYNDEEGYYKATIGEMISFQNQKDGTSQDQQQNVQFKVLGIVGKGVFSTVLKCSRITNKDANDGQTKAVALKLIRSNDVMTKAAEKEVRILRMLRASSKDTTNNHFIVRMLELADFEGEEKERKGKKLQNNAHDYSNQFFKQIPMLEYRNHTALLFDYMPNNLREVLSKFGKNVGINLSSVKSYAKQLLLALKHLSSHGIIHADIKLDNILVTSNWTTVKLCDFGSAFLESDEEYINHVPMPYLVSRFYRAPEIILGLKYDKMIDLWSVAVSLAELFTGNVFFAGRTNNDMIKRFMESIGPFSNKMIRRHISAFTKIGLKPHFEVHAGGGGNFDFRRQDIDKVTNKPIIRITSAGQNQNVVVPSKQISQVVLKSRSGNDNRGEVVRFADFLKRCLALDPGKRISLDDAIKHEFLTS